MLRFTLLFGLIILVFFASLSLAVIPKLINYQGMLTDNSGNPLTDTVNVVFKIYDNSSGGNLKWQETQNNVPVINGLFNVILGSVTPIDTLSFSQQYWLDITVDGENMPSRLKFTSVGYAYRAKFADTATVALSAPTGGGWTDDGASVRLTTISDNVGIGTTSPDAPLVISGDGTSWNRGFLYIKNNNNDAGIRLYDRADSVKHHIYNNNGDGDKLRITPNGSFASGGITIDQSGNVGIGTTSPNDDLHVADHIRVGEDDSYPSVYGELKHDGSGTGFIINANAGGGGWADMHFQTNGTTKMFLESGGNVGIATTSPNSTMHINGSLSLAYKYVNTDYTLTDSDCIIGVDVSGFKKDIYLPSAVGRSGRVYTIKVVAGGNWVRLFTSSSQTIDNYASADIAFGLWQYITVVSNGSNWLITGKNF